MKHLHYYEHTIEDDYYTQTPQNGDYVICKENMNDENFDNFLENNIGIITETPMHFETYEVKFDNIPQNLKGYFFNKERSFYIEQIIHFAKNKEDLELYIQANKYNL